MGAVKKILHLVDSITDGLLYSRKRGGGLGFSELGVQTKICALQFLFTDDPPLGAIATSARVVCELCQLYWALLTRPPFRTSR